MTLVSLMSSNGRWSRRRSSSQAGVPASMAPWLGVKNIHTFQNEPPKPPKPPKHSMSRSRERGFDWGDFWLKRERSQHASSHSLSCLRSHAHICEVVQRPRPRKYSHPSKTNLRNLRNLVLSAVLSQGLGVSRSEGDPDGAHGLLWRPSCCMVSISHTTVFRMRK